MSEIAAMKKAMRAAAKVTRGHAFQRHGAAASSVIADHGIGFASPPREAVVSGFAAIGEEIDPAPLLARLLGEGFQPCLPVMQGKGLPLLFRAWRPGDATAATTWGIREPLPSAGEARPDIVLVPLLAFDARGHRLGYGGGFYDRTLAALRAAKPIAAIGLAYDEQEVDAVPHLDYDQPLDWVLTPSGPRRCRP